MKKIIIFAFFVSNAFALNLGELRGQIRDKLGDTYDKKFSLDYTDSELNEKINIAQREISRMDCIQRRYFIDTTTNTATYVLPATIVKIYAAHYEEKASTGTYKKLDFTNVKKLDEDYANWENTKGGTPLEWYQLFLSTWNKNEIQIGLYPPPSGTEAGNNKLRVDFSEQPQDLASDTDVPFNDNQRLYPYHSAIIWGVALMIEPSQTNLAIYSGMLEIMRQNLLEVPAREGGITPRRN